MSDVFFDQFEIPVPDIITGAEGSTQAVITVQVMPGYAMITKNKNLKFVWLPEM